MLVGYSNSCKHSAFQLRYLPTFPEVISLRRVKNLRFPRNLEPDHPKVYEAGVLKPRFLELEVCWKASIFVNSKFRSKLPIFTSVRTRARMFIYSAWPPVPFIRFNYNKCSPICPNSFHRHRHLSFRVGLHMYCIQYCSYSIKTCFFIWFTNIFIHR